MALVPPVYLRLVHYWRIITLQAWYGFPHDGKALRLIPEHLNTHSTLPLPVAGEAALQTVTGFVTGLGQSFEKLGWGLIQLAPCIL